MKYSVPRFIALLALTVAAGSLQAQQTETDFLLRVAESRAMAARNESEFAAAAHAYREAYLSGARNGGVLGNMGTLLLNAKDLEGARDALLQAERYDGTTWQVRRGLEAVSSVASAQTPEGWSLPWYRVPLAWHYRLPTPLRLTIALAGWTLFWVALCLRLVGLRRLARPLIGLGLLTLVLFGSSAAASLHAAVVYDTSLALAPQQEVTP